jgi:hypothetical protein
VKGRVTKLLGFDGLKRVELPEASAGYIVAVAGFADANIGETLTCPDEPQALPLIKVDEPTLQMTFSVNDSPFAGLEGKFVTSRQIRDRLDRELETNVALRVEEGDSVVAEIKQLPLRLAWAITLHKSQGMTLDAAQIDLSKTFIMGMGYVALSRVRSLDTLNLMGINQKALMVDPVVIEIDSQLTQESERYRRAIEGMKTSELLTAQEEFIASLKYEGRLNLADI